MMLAEKFGVGGRALGIALLAVLSTHVRLSAQAPQTTVSTSGPATVALTPDACPAISAGDFVTFEWNPAFDQAGAVTGLKNFVLSFSGPDSESGASQVRPRFSFEAVPRQRLESRIQSSLTPAPNGFYAFRFEAYLPVVPPGVYHLTRVEAVPALVANYDGPTPQMTNSPLRYAFCVNVTSSTRSGRHEDPSRKSATQ